MIICQPSLQFRVLFAPRQRFSIRLFRIRRTTGFGRSPIILSYPIQPPYQGEVFSGIEIIFETCASPRYLNQPHRKNSNWGCSNWRRSRLTTLEKSNYPPSCPTAPKVRPFGIINPLTNTTISVSAHHGQAQAPHINCCSFLYFIPQNHDGHPNFNRRAFCHLFNCIGWLCPFPTSAIEGPPWSAFTIVSSR
jgi:hypothetical protein